MKHFQKGWVKIALKYIALAELQNQTSQYLPPNTVILILQHHCRDDNWYFHKILTPLEPPCLMCLQVAVKLLIFDLLIYNTNAPQKHQKDSLQSKFLQKSQIR